MCCEMMFVIYHVCWFVFDVSESWTYESVKWVCDKPMSILSQAMLPAGLLNEAFLARACARRAAQEPFTQRTPFKENLVIIYMYI